MGRICPAKLRAVVLHQFGKHAPNSLSPISESTRRPSGSRRADSHPPLHRSMPYSVLSSLRLGYSERSLNPKLQFPRFDHGPGPWARPSELRMTCGLRNGPRKLMWRSRILSTEAIQAVQSLKLAQDSPLKLDRVFRSKIDRLLKSDLLDTLTELQRQNELDLAFKVFNFVRKEHWYVADLSLFNGMLAMIGKNKMIEMVERLLLELRNEGLEPDARTYTELIGAYFKVEMVEKAMETYKLMKDSGCVPDKLTLTILIRNLEKAGEEGLSGAIKKECAEYFDYPEKFLEEVERDFPKRKSLVII